ncbi:MAG: hypothetical protein QNJ46_22850 [Leptolyngbyaceae cyanobacterium MO_188.B28]|nr:hypothetical protein [Leptolyngbyaceae cyanobacterium MO_188.B28]
MYFLKIAGFGFIHERWEDEEPRFCEQHTKAKRWKTLEEALDFGDQTLTPRLKIRWEVWRSVKGKLLPMIRPQRG